MCKRCNGSVTLSDIPCKHRQVMQKWDIFRFTIKWDIEMLNPLLQSHPAFIPMDSLVIIRDF
jgi:hypothetical protein